MTRLPTWRDQGWGFPRSAVRRAADRLAARFFAAWWGEDGVGPAEPVERVTKRFGR